MATITDVARRAGVATSTVSHVLNGTRYVSPDTARAVRDAIQAVGYTPNTLARALARSTTNTVGLALSPSRNRFFADIINATEEECTRLGMMVLLANTHDDPERELQVVAALHQRRVDGIVLAPCCAPGARAIDYLREKNVPTVLVDRLPSADCDGVGVENRRSMARVVEHLAGHGHHRIGFLGGQADFTTARERADSFRAALAQRGLPVSEALIAIGHTRLEEARASADAMLAGPNAPSALVGGNNLTTIGILQAARERGLNVPDDLALVGYDDFDWADAFAPRLTVMAQPCQAIGQTAAALLKKRIDGSGDPPGTVLLEPTFVIRETCGCRRPRLPDGQAGP